MNCNFNFLMYKHVCTRNTYAFKHHIHATNANYIMCTYQTTVKIYTSYELNAMNNVTMTTGMHTFYIMSKQICLPHYICITLPSTVVCILTPYTGTHPSRINGLQHILTKLLQNLCHKQICPSNATYMPCAQITWCVSMREVCKYVYYVRSHCGQ